LATGDTRTPGERRGKPPVPCVICFLSAVIVPALLSLWIMTRRPLRFNITCSLVPSQHNVFISPQGHKYEARNSKCALTPLSSEVAVLIIGFRDRRG
jgi:hypothetical protein